MDRLTYFENEAIMEVRTIKGKKYRYRDVPFCIYSQIKTLLKKGAEGKAWQLIKKYEQENL